MGEEHLYMIQRVSVEDLGAPWCWAVHECTAGAVHGCTARAVHGCTAGAGISTACTGTAGLGPRGA